MSDDLACGSGRQLTLFGAPEPSRKTNQVGPADPTDRVRRIAARVPSGRFLGTSSWSFPGWEGLVYDRSASKATLARKGLAAYAKHPLFQAVGLDRTFYAPLPAKDLADYAAVVPDGFRFLVKACHLCTTPRLRSAEGNSENELFLDPAFAVEQVVGPFVEGLGSKAGPLLFQFPPLGNEHTKDPRRFADRLAAFVDALPAGPDYAVELRDDRLLCPDYVAAIGHAGVAHCIGLHPRMPGVDLQSRFAPPSDRVVVRWMLQPGLGYEAAVERYEPFSGIVDEDRSTRADIAALCARQLEQGKQVLIIANNKAEGSAPETLVRLAEEIVETAPEPGGEHARR